MVVTFLSLERHSNMINTIKVVKISLVLGSIMFLASSSFASELDNDANEYDSMYRHNALESKLNMFHATVGTLNFEG